MFRSLSLIAFIILIGSFSALAQFDIKYLSYNKKNTNLRTAEADSVPVSIPFWDDFSTSTIFPDTAHWIDSDNVNIQSGVGINPPSVNVAVFDGADQNGEAYSSVGTATGQGDVLTSRFIDLSGANPATTYLSFYFQREGNGELPDREDSLSLFIKGKDSSWVKVFNVAGSADLPADEFTFKSIPINESVYFYKYFQFKFVSYGRLSGPYDTWNVDYVYLDDNRPGKIDDLTDRTITSKPSSIFGKYSSIPYDQFVAYGENYVDSASVDVINIEPKLVDVGQEPIDLNVWIKNLETGKLVVLDTGVNLQSFKAMERRTVWSSVVNPDELTDQGDSLFFTTVFSINTKDSISPINLRVNDTTRTDFSIYQELAYDDGTAEFAAGMSSTNSQVACRFFTPIEDQITAIKIYFPKFGAQTGKSFVIKVWQNLNDDDSGLKYSQDAVVQSPSTFNEYGFYKFSKPVSVSDTFYVGFEQTVNDFFLVGLDKNKDTGDDIFFNPDVAWQQNANLKGTLMIRPVFGNTEDIITGLDPEEVGEGFFFPNPSNGNFRYKGKAGYFCIYDIYGKQVLDGYLEKEDQLDLSGQKPGVYIVRFSNSTFQKSTKLVVF